MTYLKEINHYFVNKRVSKPLKVLIIREKRIYFFGVNKLFPQQKHFVFPAKTLCFYGKNKLYFLYIEIVFIYKHDNSRFFDVSLSANPSSQRRLRIMILV